MDATLKSVAERGFDATPVTEVEADAGLRPGNGSFYRHGPAKEGPGSRCRSRDRRDRVLTVGLGSPVSTLGDGRRHRG
jgi:hypothetical protein